MRIIESLREIGLTESESKVYLALLALGPSKKGEILRESRIAASKLYILLDKLQDKGLVSSVTTNGVLTFSAAPPETIKDYLHQKIAAIQEKERALASILPSIKSYTSRTTHKPSIEIFTGWRGLDTVYTNLINNLKKGEQYLVIGASKGIDPERSATFYGKHGRLARKKGIILRFLFNENSRGYVREYERAASITMDKRFIPKQEPVEIFVAKDLTAIVMLQEAPLIVLIRDPDTAKSFRTYFDLLWGIAKP